MAPSPASTRTRFAPSPTGLLHIGGVRTALFNKLFALSTGGVFVLRIEDTDAARSDPAYEAAIMDDLKWLGLEWDEGPGADGPYGPYRQSERTGTYNKLAEELLDGGRAYRCYCSPERLDALKKEQLAAGKPPRYDGRCWALKEAPSPGAPPVVRFKVPPGTVRFIDLVHGRMAFDATSFGDFVITASDGTPSYNFAAAVDDSLMRMTHVIRGDDHLPNTPRQILILDALGLHRPEYAHVPLIHGKDGLPLSKREAGASVRALKDEGYLPEAVVNAAARLGWSPGEALLGPDDMAAAFSIDRLSKSPSCYDPERLRGLNKAAIAAADPLRAARLASIECADAGLLKNAVEAVKAGSHTLKELKRLAGPLVGEPAYGDEAAAALKEAGALKVLRAFAEEFSMSGEITADAYDRIVKAAAQKTGEKGRRLFMPLRAALTGMTEGIELNAVATTLGGGRILERLDKVIKKEGNL